MRLAVRFIVFMLLLIPVGWAQSVSAAPPVTPIYGPPYHAKQMPNYTPGLPNASIAAAVSQWWGAYQAYWSSAFPGCSYTTQTYSPSSSNGGLELGLTLHGTCHGGQNFYGTLQCPPGYKLSGNTCIGDKQVAINPSDPFIPVGSGIVDNHILTMSYLDLVVTQGDDPIAGLSVPIKSDRKAKDRIDNNGVTNSAGTALAFISTRDQPGTSTITSATSDIKTSRPSVINWLPAKYGSPFEVTCYGVAQESLDIKGQLVRMPGLPGKYHESFVADTDRQGTGILLNGQYIQKHHGKYVPVMCPVTASGICATAGETIAVDLKVIPLAPSKGVFSHIDISGIGERTAEDTGGKIGNYHIDVFFGRTADDYKACIQYGKSYGHIVTFLNYGN